MSTGLTEMNARRDLSDYLVENDWERPAAPVFAIERLLRKNLGVHYPTATIADNLRHVADDFVTESTELLVVGNDLPNVADPLYVWSRKCLPEWLKRGAKVKYFAINPSAKAELALARLGAGAPGRLEARRLDPAAFQDPAGRQYATLWERFHFVVFKNKSQLWIEMDHPPGQTTANDCYYFGPGTAETLDLYDDCERSFRYMFENFGTPLAPMREGTTAIENRTVESLR